VTGRLRELTKRLAAAARGGRVAHSGFLSEDDAARCLAQLRVETVRASANGGHPAAHRRIVTARPDQLPEAGVSLTGLYLAGVHDAGDARAAVLAAGVVDDEVGDVVPHADGVSLFLLPEAAERLAGSVRCGGTVVTAETVPVERIASGSRRTLRLVVPALRADAVGSKAFGASRSWFVKGVAAGKVRIDGEPAGKAAQLEVGSELWAEGLGRARLLEVEGETKRGNLKVVVEVEKP